MTVTFARKGTAAEPRRTAAPAPRARLRPLRRRSRATDRPFTFGNIATSLALDDLVQTKSLVSHPHDPLEQEADRVADRVMHMTEAPNRQDEVLPGTTEPLVQRSCQSCNDDEELIQPKRSDSGTTSPITPGTNVPSVVDALRPRSPGRPLSSSERSVFEPSFGRDFGAVRIHADAQSDHLARLLSARSYTIGHDIAFASGQYNPGTYGGRKLLAHELTHVVQQEERREGAHDSHYVQREIIPGNPPAPLESFVGWVRRAIDDLPTSASVSSRALYPEVASVLSGLRDHVSLIHSEDDSRIVTRDGGVFVFSSNSQIQIPSSIGIKLEVTDEQNSSVDGEFVSGTTHPTIVIYSNRFLGRDHTELGLILFHEALHFLFYISRIRGSVFSRDIASHILSDENYHNMRARLVFLLEGVVPGDSRIEDIAERLTEETIVRAETNAYDAFASSTGMVLMDASSYRAHMREYIFGLYLSREDLRNIQQDNRREQGLNQLLDELYIFYRSHYSRRLRHAGLNPNPSIRIIEYIPPTVFVPMRVGEPGPATPGHLPYRELRENND